MINDLLGLKIRCKMSKDLKNESGYTENEFEVIMKVDSESESGYTAIVSGYDDEEEGSFSENWDGEVVCKNILFGSWETISKEKI
jgi:hypothetical protein